MLLLIQVTDENLQVLPVLLFFCLQKYDSFQIIFALKRFPTTTKHVEQTRFPQLRFSTGWHKKTGTIEKPNKNWRNPQKKKLFTEIEPLQLAF